MKKILITNYNQFNEIILSFEKSLSNIKEIFSNENKTFEKINETSIWTGKTQQVIYSKYKLLAKNFEPIEESIQIYIDFLKNTLQEYKDNEDYLNKNLELNDENLDVDS